MTHVHIPRSSLVGPVYSTEGYQAREYRHKQEASHNGEIRQPFFFLEDPVGLLDSPGKTARGRVEGSGVRARTGNNEGLVIMKDWDGNNEGLVIMKFVKSDE